MANYGIKVSYPGKNVLTCEPYDLVFSSQYPTFNRHTYGSGTITHSGGRTHTIPHGLGYVPMFEVQAQIYGIYGNTKYYTLPYVDGNNAAQCYAYADATNLYVRVKDDFAYSIFDRNDMGEETSGIGYFQGICRVEEDNPTVGDSDGAIRFGSVTIAKNTTLIDAYIRYYMWRRSGSSNMYWKVWGIAEDNTGGFGSDPLGRAVTVNSHRPEGNPSQGSWFSFGVKEATQDIINRSGWSSGNNLGYIMRRDGQMPANNGFADSMDSGQTTQLYILTTNTLLNYKYTIFKDRIE